MLRLVQYVIISHNLYMQAHYKYKFPLLLRQPAAQKTVSALTIIDTIMQNR
jgi:hypothetical protein